MGPDRLRTHPLGLASRFSPHISICAAVTIDAGATTTAAVVSITSAADVVSTASACSFSAPVSPTFSAPRLTTCVKGPSIHDQRQEAPPCRQEDRRPFYTTGEPSPLVPNSLSSLPSSLDLEGEPSSVPFAREGKEIPLLTSLAGGLVNFKNTRHIVLTHDLSGLDNWITDVKLPDPPTKLAGCLFVNSAM
ncbi:hypothetical protein EJB05_48549, partial [Eragrostis curvula]